MKQIIENMTYDEERALYHLQDARVAHCTFAGPADGESALKEARRIEVEDCRFSLRYPLWHTQDFSLIGSGLDEKTRAPIWYAHGGRIEDTSVDGIKCLRECTDIRLKGCKIDSPEFGWKCSGITIEDSGIESEYILFESREIRIDRLRLKGKYSFQYTENVEIRDSVLDTKDAFWHAANVTVRNSVVKGEYLGWFSDGLTLIDCEIIGTQPLCYCKNLKLVNCTMEGTDLAFEYSDVEADIKGHVLSVKNPRSGLITLDSVGEVIYEDAVMETNGKVAVRDGNCL